MVSLISGSIVAKYGYFELEIFFISWLFCKYETRYFYVVVREEHLVIFLFFLKRFRCTSGDRCDFDLQPQGQWYFGHDAETT